MMAARRTLGRLTLGQIQSQSREGALKRALARSVKIMHAAAAAERGRGGGLADCSAQTLVSLREVISEASAWREVLTAGSDPRRRAVWMAEQQQMGQRLAARVAALQC
jgi:hypothetical protein